MISAATGLKSVRLLVGLSVVSLLVMITVDAIIGSRAEFLNAYSVMQRLLGEQPTAGISLVARKLGPWGELGVVLAANLAIGGMLSAAVRLFSRQAGR